MSNNQQGNYESKSHSLEYYMTVKNNQAHLNIMKGKGLQNTGSVKNHMGNTMFF
jgi:hypothetical protein